jgi:hypothetical protein
VSYTWGDILARIAVLAEARKCVAYADRQVREIEARCFSGQSYTAATRLRDLCSWEDAKARVMQGVLDLLVLSVVPGAVSWHDGMIQSASHSDCPACEGGRFVCAGCSNTGRLLVPEEREDSE